MYTCAQAGAQFVHSVCTSLNTACTLEYCLATPCTLEAYTCLGTCVHFQAVSKLGHSNFYSSANIPSSILRREDEMRKAATATSTSKNAAATVTLVETVLCVLQFFLRSCWFRTQICGRGWVKTLAMFLQWTNAANDWEQGHVGFAILQKSICHPHACTITNTGIWFWSLKWV